MLGGGLCHPAVVVAGGVPEAVVEGVRRGTDTEARGHQRGARRRRKVEAIGEVLATAERSRPPERCALQRRGARRRGEVEVSCEI